MKIQNLSVQIRSKKILTDINFECESGVCAVIGENGAGKTTLFRSILNLQKYTGNITSKAVETKDIGYLPQRFETLKELNVYETLEYYAVLKKIQKNKWGIEIEKVLHMVNLEHESGTKVRKLSGGMNQRLGIAQAILGNPQLIVFDEPTVGLDPKERINFRMIVESLKKQNPNLLIMISSHETHELEIFSDKVLFLHKGSVVEYDDIKKLKEKLNVDSLEQVYFELIERSVS